ncbi:MAG: DUF1573 domain-containing protein [Planctomycetota bacterium]
MKRSVSAFSAAVLIALVLSPVLAADPQEKPPAPKRTYRPLPPPADFSPGLLEVDNADFDWGGVMEGEKVRHDYVLRNVGGSPVTIERVQPSCGCTLGAKPNEPILPGKTGIVTLEINTRRFSGHVKKSASIVSNAKNSPLTVYIGGNVETVYSIEPPNPTISVVKGNPPQTAKVTVRRNPNAKKQFAVKAVRPEGKVVQASLAEVTPGELYEITLSADVGDDQRKYFYERVALAVEVDGKSMDSDFQVSIPVKERIEAQPKTAIYFNRTETQTLRQPGAQPLSKSVEIVSLGGPDHRFQVTGVVAAPPAPAPGTPQASAPNPSPPAAGPSQYFETKVEPVEPGKRYKLTVLMKKLPEGNLRSIRETLKVETDDPAVPDVPVTVMAAVY